MISPGERAPRTDPGTPVLIEIVARALPWSYGARRDGQRPRSASGGLGRHDRQVMSRVEAMHKLSFPFEDEGRKRPVRAAATRNHGKNELNPAAEPAAGPG